VSEPTEAEKKAAEAEAAKKAEAEAAAKALAEKEAKAAADKEAKKQAAAAKRTPATAPAKPAKPAADEGDQDVGTRRLLLRRTDKAGWVAYLSDFGGLPGWNDDVEKARIITNTDDAHTLLDAYEGDGGEYKIVKAPA